MSNVQSIKGFILTRHAKDTRDGITLYFWLKTSFGAKQVIVKDELAVFFVHTEEIQHAKQVLLSNNIPIEKSTELSLKTFEQQPVTGVYFRYLSDFYRARDCLKNKSIKLFEDDFRPEERYLMERFVTARVEFFCPVEGSAHTTQNATAPYMASKCRAIPDDDITFDVSLSTVSLDIECSMQGELFSIGLYSEDITKKKIETVLMIGDHNCQTSSKLSKQDAETALKQVVWCVDEAHLLAEFVLWIKCFDPDVIIGWNVIQFDFRVLQKRYDHFNQKFRIARDGGAPKWREHRSSEQKFIDINGRVVLDGIDLLKTATFNFPSFSLDNVSKTLLGLNKKVDDVDNRINEIINNFNHDKLALAAYNLEDCRLVTLIFKHTDLLAFAMLRAQLTGLSIDRIGGSVAAFTNLYLPKLHRAGYVAPNLGDGLVGLESPGGYVMESIPGLYRNVLVLDFKSLYPSIIRTFNIDPMGMIEGLKDPKTSIAGFDDAYFSREQHFLPDIITQLWLERDKAKQQNNAALSQAIKIIMNSFYGILGSTGCRFYDPRLASSITKRGHELLITTKDWIEDKGYKVIYGDTDSIFVHVGEDKETDECLSLGKELAIFINEQWNRNLADRFDIVSQLELEFETHFLQFFMPTIRGSDTGTKKRYAGLVNKNNKKEIVFKGLESVRTDWTQLAKDFQKTLYLKVFNNEPVEQFIEETVNRTLNGEYDSALIYRKRIRRKLDQYVKNIPPHIKAARAADELNFKLGKPLKYQQRGWIEYVLTTSGPQAIEYVNSPLDYQLYIDRQLASVADAILPFIGKSFEKITAPQQTLF